jgi:hypothetical protein
VALCTDLITLSELFKKHKNLQIGILIRHAAINYKYRRALSNRHHCRFSQFLGIKKSDSQFFVYPQITIHLLILRTENFSRPKCSFSVFVERSSTIECYHQPPLPQIWKRLQASKLVF